MSQRHWGKQRRTKMDATNAKGATAVTTANAGTTTTLWEAIFEEK
jgi:hypothetical protein